MADASVLTAIVPVVVGGLIGLVSSLGGHWFLHGLQSRTEALKKRSEKFEALIMAFYEYDNWLDAMKNYRVLGREDPGTMSPFPKIKTICSVYFPQFREQVIQLGLAADAFELWMLDQAQKRLRDGKIAGDGHAETYRDYAERRHQLIVTLEGFAQRELSPKPKAQWTS